MLDGRTDAFYSDMPRGRAYFLVGSGTKYEYFQSGYASENLEKIEESKTEITMFNTSGNHTTFYDSYKDKDELKDGLLEENPWVTAATLIAEHRIEHHMDNNAGIGHADIPDYAVDEDETSIDSYVAKDYRCMEFMWHEESINVNPLDAVCRKETKEEVLAALTDKQFEVFVLHYRDGYTQREIAERLHISQVGVKHHLDLAKNKIRMILEKSF